MCLHTLLDVWAHPLRLWLMKRIFRVGVQIRKDTSFKDQYPFS